MAITTEYLDSIRFEIAKQKYYNANKVNAKMEEIKSAVAELITENELLRAELVEIGCGDVLRHLVEVGAFCEVGKLTECTVRILHSGFSRRIGARKGAPLERELVEACVVDFLSGLALDERSRQMLGAPFDHPCGLKLFELELGAGPAAFKGGIAFFRKRIWDLLTVHGSRQFDDFPFSGFLVLSVPDLADDSVVFDQLESHGRCLGVK